MPFLSPNSLRCAMQRPAAPAGPMPSPILPGVHPSPSRPAMRAQAPWASRSAIHWAIALSCIPLWPQTTLAQTWPQANDTVAQFPRGHMDLLKWEQQHLPADSPASASGTSSPMPLTLSLALQAALHGQTAGVLREGMSSTERAALNSQRQAHILEVRRAWIEAVSAQQSRQYSQDILQAAQAGAELADRMARLGNWSRARQMQEELLLWDAQARLDNAQLRALASAQTLWQKIGNSAALGPADGPPPWPDAQTVQQALPQLPEWPQTELPELNVLTQQALTAHPQWPTLQSDAQRQIGSQHPSTLAATRQSLAQAWAQAQADGSPLLRATAPWSHSAEKALQADHEAQALQRRIVSDVRIAHAAYQSARHQAQRQQREVQRLYTALEQESLLRYNGMLKSTWDLLASARQRIQSVDATHQAQRQAWLAWADLQAVLNGLPYSGMVGAAPNATSSTPAGH